MPELGIHCREIMESRHVDVLEMDAASNTGIDDVREIIEAARYKPASARYRVFIIDEVHMLSKAAFNGLLKTLEEPPPHVKFIFATTEIRKVPVTILSRCQRFDLRRVEQGVLAAHLAKIVAAEGRAADPDALDIIARAAEGSVRDGLSLLDQALALGSGRATADLVLEMLGIAGRGAVFALLNRIFEGETAAALACLNGLHDSGADPAMILTDLASAIHEVSRLKAVPGVSPPDYSPADKAEAERLAALLTMSRLALAWQMLLKGLDEVSRAGRPFAAAEMLIIRMCHASGLPAPAELAGALQGKTAAPREVRPEKREAAPAAITLQDAESSSGEIVAQHQAPLDFASFESLVAHIGVLRDIKLKTALEEQVELVRFGPAFLELHLLDGAPPNLAQDLSRKLRAWTGQRWVVSLSEARGQRPLGVQKREADAKLMEEMRRHPAVKRVLHHFPDAQIKSVRAIEK
jgi:DNA polymerase-3 subunit gamma/tau